MDRRTFLAGLAATTAVSSAAQSESARVRIGFSIPQTGPLAAPSASQSQAYGLWKDLLNAQGGLPIAGIGRREIEFVVYDDQSQGAKAAQAYERLCTVDHVDLLLSPYASPMHLGVLPVIERFKRPVIANTIGTTAVRDAHSKYMFLTQPLPDVWGAEVGNLVQSLGAKRVAVIGVQVPFAIETRKFAIPALEKLNIPIVFNQQYAADIQDMTPLLSRIQAAQPDFLLAFSYLNDSFTLVRQARELNLKVEYFFDLLGPSQASFISRFGPNADGIISCGFWSRHAKTPGTQEFFTAYRKAWKMDPDDKDSTIAYASCQILEQAVAKSGLDPEKLRETLSRERFETIVGPVKYDVDNVNTGATPGFTEIQNDVNEIIWPRSLATAEIIRKPPWA